MKQLLNFSSTRIGNFFALSAHLHSMNCHTGICAKLERQTTGLPFPVKGLSSTNLWQLYGSWPSATAVCTELVVNSCAGRQVVSNVCVKGSNQGNPIAVGSVGDGSVWGWGGCVMTCVLPLCFGSVGESTDSGVAFLHNLLSSGTSYILRACNLSGPCR